MRTQVGDRYVVESMRQNDYNLGGEQSGHLIFLDHASTGDGIIGALQVLALMMRTGKPLSELAANAMDRLPQVLENVTLPTRVPLDRAAPASRAFRRRSKRRSAKRGASSSGGAAPSRSSA